MPIAVVRHTNATALKACVLFNTRHAGHDVGHMATVSRHSIELSAAHGRQVGQVQLFHAPLLVAQSNQRINPRRPASRHVAGER